MLKIKKFKPKTPGTRFKIVLRNFRLRKKKIEKYLIMGLVKKGGRNNQGKITVRHRGGGHKKKYRQILFKRSFLFDRFIFSDICLKITCVVVNFEYDPNRTAFLAKIYCISTHSYFYILAPKGLIIGDFISFWGSGLFVPYEIKQQLSIGHSALLYNIPIGSLIHNVELKPRKGGQLVRTAGNFAQIMEKFDKVARVRLRSGEQRFILLTCSASLGMIDNDDKRLTSKGKAGCNRWLGKRPHVRGTAMNPVDHPHGGGQGKTSGGRPSVTPKGRPTKGQPTRKRLLNKNIKLSVRLLKMLKKKSTRKGKFTY